MDGHRPHRAAGESLARKGSAERRSLARGTSLPCNRAFRPQPVSSNTDGSAAQIERWGQCGPRTDPPQDQELCIKIWMPSRSYGARGRNRPREDQICTANCDRIAVRARLARNRKL